MLRFIVYSTYPCTRGEKNKLKQALKRSSGENKIIMAGNIAKITAINFDGVPTDLVNDCSQYVIRVINEAGYGDNVRIRGVAASALEQDGTVSSASTKPATAGGADTVQGGGAVEEMEADGSDDDDVVFVRASPPPAARVVVPVEIDGDGSGREDANETGSSSDSTSNSSESSSSSSSDEGSDAESAPGDGSPKYR
jgi:hypothetical protein